MVDYTNFAEFLNVELTEDMENPKTFALVDREGKTFLKFCRITKSGLWYLDDNDIWKLVSDSILVLLVEGSLIAMIPYRPNLGDIYYYYNGENSVESLWTESWLDFANFTLGNCFETEALAEDLGAKVFSRVSSLYIYNRA